MLAAIVHDLAAACCGAFGVLLVQAWLIQRHTAAAISGRSIPMIVKLLAIAVIVVAMAAYAICTWADYAVSGSVRRATGCGR